MLEQYLIQSLSINRSIVNDFHTTARQKFTHKLTHFIRPFSTLIHKSSITINIQIKKIEFVNAIKPMSRPKCKNI